MHPQSIPYADFLSTKRRIFTGTGWDTDPEQINAQLFHFQRDLTRWSLRKGRAALFADAGLGKTAMQLEWARLTGQPTLILAPLAVAQQTVREGQKFGIPVTYARAQAAADPTGITITNYEMLSHFDPAKFGAVVLDESSILKSFEGKTRTSLIETFADTPLRLCCTATPAPNDIAELANHAEFLGILSRTELLSMFFVHDEVGWRLKRHAARDFYRWLASWGMSVKHPRDLGYEQDGYDLPPLTIHAVTVPSDYQPADRLFAIGLRGVTERSAVRKSTIAARVKAAQDLVFSDPHESWLIWCGLNAEGQTIHNAIPGSVVVEGKDPPDFKERALLGFAQGDPQVLVTKPSISGFGMNWQHCARMIFLGLGDSYEQYYQAIRRCWRFGQMRPVEVYVIVSDAETEIVDNVRRKEAQASELSRELIANLIEFEQAEIGQRSDRMDYAPTVPITIPSWLEADHARVS